MAELRSRLAWQQPMIGGHRAARVLQTFNKIEIAVLIRTHLTGSVIYAEELV